MEIVDQMNENENVLGTFALKAEAIASAGVDADVAVDRLSTLTSTIAGGMAETRAPAANVAELDLSAMEAELQAAAQAEEGSNPFDMRGALGRRWTEALKDPLF